MSDSSENSLFPLPLSPIEVCWLLEDSPSHPMQFFLRLHLEGQLQRHALEAAVTATAARHPLFSAVVEKTGRASWRWVAAPELQIPILWQTGDPALLPAAERLDITKELGLRVIVIESSDTLSASIFLQIQHTVCDGLSTSELASDLMTAYAEQLQPDATYKYKKLDPQNLRSRGTTGLSRKAVAQWLWQGAKSLKTFRKFYKRKPVTLVERPIPAESDAMPPTPPVLIRRYSREETVALNKQARAANTNLNGWLLRNLFTAFTGWSDREPHQIFRVTTPVSLRAASHRACPAANIVGLVCFDRQIGQLEDSDALQTWIDNQIAAMRTDHRGMVLPMLLRVLRHWPEKLASGIRRKRFSGSALLSNLGPVMTTCMLPKKEGKITLEGGLVLEAVEFIPVLRPGHCATVSACLYANQLTLAMHHDPRMLEANEAQELFAQYMAALD